MATKKSRGKSERQILGVLSPKKADEILVELANLPGEWPLVENPDTLARIRDAIERISSRHPDTFTDCIPFTFICLRDLVRMAWTAPDPRYAEWYLVRIRLLHHDTVRRVREVRNALTSLEPEIPGGIPGTVADAIRFIRESVPPPITDVEAASFYLQKNLRRARRCPNLECPAPYFLASKNGQKYCSPECAVPAQREAKRRWWDENKAKQFD